MTLGVYGPGGPFTPMKECAGIFASKSGIETIVSMGVPEDWIDEARRGGDIIYMGAEYMMSDFISQYPGMVEAAEVVNLYAREVGIIARKSNPLGISSLADLGRPGVGVLDVGLENMGDLQCAAPGINIRARVVTGQEGFKAWNSGDIKIDAWITYRSWHFQMRESSDFISLPPQEKVFRCTPAAITTVTGDRAAAQKFLDFLKSDEGHSVFRKWGWE